jgi:hypothetical protein
MWVIADGSGRNAVVTGFEGPSSGAANGCVNPLLQRVFPQVEANFLGEVKICPIGVRFFSHADSL